MSGLADPDGHTGLRDHWRTVLLALVASVGVLVVAALVRTQYQADHARDQALRWQAHTYEVIIRAHALSSTLAAAEAELGRYVISGERRLGQRYSADWGKAGAEIDGLATAVADSPRQIRNIAELRSAYDARGRELAEAASYSTFKRNMSALGRYYQLRESPSLQRLSGVVERIIALENGQLTLRTRVAQRTLDESYAITRALMVVLALIVMGAALLGWLTVQALAQRAAADAESAAQRERAAELEEAVAAATAELRREAREREDAEAQLRQVQKMEAVGQLTGGIAHDFNNMLAVVLGGLELAKRQIGTAMPEAQRHLDNAMEGADRAAALTRRLLAFARAEALLPESLEVGTLIAGMSDLLDRTLGETIEVQAEDAGLGWHVWADRHQLENALLNLAVNARDAMDGRGTVVLATGGATLGAGDVGECRAGDYVTIAVRDSGAGMRPDVLERVFEPFFTTKPVGKGTGLGLSQIFGFVRQSGGEIAIESAVGRGTTVTLFLPRHIAADVTPASTVVEVPAVRPAPVLRVLVVEDDPRVLGATMGALAELGHQATPCEDPSCAEAAIDDAADRFDLIISDVMMPGCTGPEMIAALKPRIGDVAVLFVTGYAGEADAEMFGGHPVLRKPFTLRALERAIAEALTQRDAGQLAAE